MNDQICIIIPSRNEPLLTRTVQQYLHAAERPDRVEVFVILDGWDIKAEGKIDQEMVSAYQLELERIHHLADRDSRVRLLEFKESRGVRVAANQAAALTEAAYLIKLDSHCELSPGWDVELQSSYDVSGKDTLIIPRICGLDPNTFDHGTRFFDYLYIDSDIHQRHWPEYAQRVPENKTLVEVMSNLGASWFTSRQYWWELELHDEVMFGAWGESAPETSLKCWLSGGRQLLNKRVWFAHLFRRRFPYSISGGMVRENKRRTKEFWLNHQYPLQIHPIEWLVGKFWPVPTWEKGTLCRTV